MEEHVVVIYPHPDDESFGAAGTMTEFRKQGVPVTYLCGTLGEMGRNMGSPIFANRETLPEIRKKELIEACNVLDVELKLLGYRDKTIEYEDINEVASHLKKILEDIKPSLVITHYPDHAVHPDHNALGAAAIEAVRLMDTDKRPKVWAQAITNNHVEMLGNPDIINDITEYFDIKMKAILSHSSQASGIIGQFRKDQDDVDEVAKARFSTEQFYTWNFEK
ncbi:bacillithiol biosynthesis deacetylase BshB2 [Virgibacillus indicus]|uniref:Bacillithiol biosynthesis deacetylase BshB2 n=1 Tax=Virgibacillus indicus TaxID=2024554 RepID=A0A265N9U9_9BACI|nr:bacillithiol biosynthesis deacetylase BshB2 [Virgibacillus indicus]OZU88773.1 bacillithiol biosynthesis deacetylase BshB2 [Virgibacillus indicus]